MPNLKRFGLALTISLIIGIVFFYFIPIFGISPKTNLFLQIIFFGLFSFSFRRIIYTILASKITQPVILIGKTKYLEEIQEMIYKNPQIGLKTVFHADNFQKTINNCLNTKNSIFIFEKNIDKIENKQIAKLFKNGNEIIDITKAYEKYFVKIPIQYISQDWIIENITTKRNIGYDLLRRLIDIIFSLSILTITSPILLITVIARQIEDGRPIFIKQKRVGLNNKIFNLYKIRSMVVLSSDGSAEKTGEARWSTGKNDPRITLVGKVIRKLHIDEIPQMINILKGDISLVGPRPERPEFVDTLEKHIPYYELRHIVKPGFTGWAQIKYRYARTIEDSREKFEYDLYYIKNKNIFLDFGIILKTIQIIFTH